MATGDRASFLGLVILFLFRDRVVWLSGVLGGAAAMIMLTEFGEVASGAVAAVVILGAIVASVQIDRRREPRQRILVRGRKISPRRLAAFVLTVLIISGAIAMFAASFVRTQRTVMGETIRRETTPNQKRGWY
jgi:hypothetical protein